MPRHYTLYTQSRNNQIVKIYVADWSDDEAYSLDPDRNRSLALAEFPISAQHKFEDQHLRAQALCAALNAQIDAIPPLNVKVG